MNERGCYGPHRGFGAYGYGYSSPASRAAIGAEKSLAERAIDVGANVLLLGIGGFVGYLWGRSSK